MHEVGWLWEGAKQVMDKTLRGNSRSVHENLAHCSYERQISANTMCIVSWFCLCNTKDMGNISKSGTKLPPFLYFLLFHAPWTWENIWERDNMAEDIAEPSMSFFLHWNVPVAVHRILIYWIKLNWCISKPLWPTVQFRFHDDDSGSKKTRNKSPNSISIMLSLFCLSSTCLAIIICTTGIMSTHTSCV